MGYRVGTFVPILSMFAVGILFDESLVPDSVVIWDSRGIFSYEILLDKFLFAVLEHSGEDQVSD